MQIGIWDTTDETWLGTDEGPYLYAEDQEGMANRAALILNTRCNYQPGTVIAKPCDDTQMRALDDFEPPLSFADAVEKLANGE